MASKHSKRETNRLKVVLYTSGSNNSNNNSNNAGGGTTVRAPVAQLQRLPRRVAFLRKTSGSRDLILDVNNLPIPLGLNASTIDCYSSKGLVIEEEVGSEA